MAALREYYYNEQLKKYLLQFMAIFGGMSVSVGSNETDGDRLITIPIASASKDRVVAAIKGDNTQNKVLRIPIFSASISSIDQAPELRKGIGVERRQSYVPTGGLVPNDINVVEQRMPVPYKLMVELNIWVSNQNQHYQVIEQIMSLFDPSITIQHSDEIFDWTSLTKVELENVRLEENTPAGVDRRVIQSVMEFSMPIHLSIPSVVHQQYIKDINMRVGAVTQSTELAQEIIDELDADKVEYVYSGADGLDIF